MTALLLGSLRMIKSVSDFGDYTKLCAQLCDYTKKHLVVLFKWVSCMVYESQKAVREREREKTKDKMEQSRQDATLQKQDYLRKVHLCVFLGAGGAFGQCWAGDGGVTDRDRCTYRAKFLLEAVDWKSALGWSWY